MSDKKKPQQIRSQQMVRDIAEATAAVVSEAGVPATTMEMIANKAGVSPGSIYQYYSNKKSVIGDFVGNQLDESRVVSLQVLEQSRDLPIPELVHNVITMMIAFYEQTEQTSKEVYRHVGELGKSPHHMKNRRDVTEALKALLKSRRQEMSVEDTDMAATILIHGCMGAMTATFIDPEFPYKMSDLRDQLVTMATRYLLG